MERKVINIDGLEFEFIGSSRGTRCGFAHDCTLFINGRNACTAHVYYLNRTWECYRYQSVFKNAISTMITDRIEQETQDFKKKHGYKRLTAARRQELQAVLQGVEPLNTFRKVYEAL